LLIGAFVDGSVTGITGVMTLLTVPLLAPDGNPVSWSPNLLVVPVLGGLLSTFLTIQKALANTSTFMAELRGVPVITTTVLGGTEKTPGQVITKSPVATVFEQHVALPPAPTPTPVLPPELRAQVEALIETHLKGEQARG